MTMNQFVVSSTHVKLFCIPFSLHPPVKSLNTNIKFNMHTRMYLVTFFGVVMWMWKEHGGEKEC